MPDGSCALSSEVAYVNGTTGVDGAPCTQAMPCTRIEEGVARKPIVKVSGTVKDRCSLNGATAIILADPGAKLTPQISDNGIGLEVKNASHIQVYDLEISHANGGGISGPGVALADTSELQLTRVTLNDNAGDGAIITGGHLTCTLCMIARNKLHGMSSAGTLTVTQSTIMDNINGGILINNMDAVFQIVGNIFFRNGQPDKLTGGVNIQVNGSDVNRLDFNSFSQNSAASALGQGIHCISSATQLTASNNIVWDNGKPIQGSAQVNVGGCAHAYSDIGPLAFTSGTSNMSIDPGFSNEAFGDLHLTKDSMVRGKANPGLIPSGLAAKDIDGDARPTATPADMGADQYLMQ
jgi:hypothetical protein